MKQANQIKELFGGLREICKVAYLLSLELTWAKRSGIEAHEKTKYAGFEKIKGLAEMGEKALMKQWKDLITCDTTGVELASAEELAILDCAFIMQQISAEEVRIDSSRELVPQLVELVTGKTYDSIVLPSSPTAISLTTPKSVASTTPISPVKTSVATTTFNPSPLAPISTVTSSEIEIIKRQLKAQEEETKKAKEQLQTQADALRIQQAEAEAAKAETKALAEKLAKVQDKLTPTTVEGGAEALVFADPKASSTTPVTVSYAEFHALKKQVTQLTQTTMETREQVEAVSVTVYNLQDGKKTDRGKAATTQITHARDLALLEANRKKKEEATQVAQKAKAKQVVTAQDLM